MPKKYYCYVCKTKLVGMKEFKKHALTHYDGKRCPYCNMKTKNLFIHLSFYHIKFKKKMLFHRDLAILAKETNSLSILDDPELKLNRFEKYLVLKLMKKL
jgi:DNA-directed RNA polymerase subunit RPC12/RpoP